MTSTPTTSTRRASDEALLQVWSTLAARRSAYDSMIWQTPALGLTAQAFLLTLALGSGTSALGRVVSATLSLALSIMVIQLLAKHRQGEFQDTLTLERLERLLGFDESIGVLPHGRPEDRNTADERKIIDRELTLLRGHHLQRLWRTKSVRLWILGQLLFAGVSFAVAVVVTLGLVVPSLSGALS